MAPLKVLICGGGCAGPALAFWLARSGHRVIVVERTATLRDSGAQIDLREQGIQVVKRMGLIEAIRARCVDEAGSSIIDEQGNVLGTIMANTSGKGAQSVTSEYEIMRGDFIQVLYEATKDKVEYVFGKTVDRIEQDEKEVMAHFSDGSSDTFDLLVGADGQGSRIRKAILPPNAPDPYFSVGFGIAYWFIPRVEEDNNIRTTCHHKDARMTMRRAHSLTESHVLLFIRDSKKELSGLSKFTMDQQKEFWRQKFRDVGGHVPRYLEGLKTTDNFYCQEVIQVKTDTWSKGRVVLLGDAGYCPSPFTGMGTTLALVGAYVLAGEIHRNSEDLPKALEKYEKTLRPFVNEVQKLNHPILRLMMPDSQWGIKVLQFIVWIVCLFRIPELVSRFSSEDKGGWPLPDYPELRVTS